MASISMIAVSTPPSAGPRCFFKDLTAVASYNMNVVKIQSDDALQMTVNITKDRRPFMV